MKEDLAKMHQVLSKSPPKSRPKTTSVQPQTPLFPLNIQKMAVKVNPVAIGTRGTVGSLIMQEIDYFARLELSRSSSIKTSRQVSDLASNGEYSKPELQPASTIPKRKKKSRSKLVPSLCSMVDVVESKQPNTFTYKNLKAELKRSD